MGCGQSSSANAGDSDESRVSAAIDAQLKKDRAADRARIKILLLGAGESGKSTVIKQMKLMYSGTYSTEERSEYREVIWSNMIQSMQAVLDAADSLGIRIDDQSSRMRAQTLLKQSDLVDVDASTNQLPPAIADAIGGLWADPAVKSVVARQNEFQLNDSAPYFFNNCSRLAAKDYIPSDDDILRSRVKTTGIQETQLTVEKYTFCIYDVGGQRSERKKWIHCFENVNVLLFLVAISEYDQVLYEDESVSRISEAMTLFDSISNSRWFSKSTLMLFLNKIDLFAQKLPVSPLSRYLPEYRGPPSDLQAACQFMLQLFGSLYHPTGHSKLYSHFTSATDTSSVRVVLRAVQDTIIKERFAEAGLL